MTALLASFLVRSMAVGLLGLAILALAKRRSAAFQHAVAVLTLAAMCALPLISALMPMREVEIDLVPVRLVPLRVQPEGHYRIERPTTPARPSPDVPVMLLIWGAGTAVLLVRMASGLWQLRAAIRRSRPVLAERDIRLREDPRSAIPMTAWYRSSIILLPKDWRSWSQERLERVLAHESAHIARGDWFWQMFSTIAAAALWPNPLVHLLVRRVRALAERAADDQVLRLGGEPSRYASDLLDISQGVSATTLRYGIPMAAKADVARRVEMILNKKVNRRPMTRLSFAVVALILCAISVPLASWAFSPKIVRTGDPVSEPTFTLKVRVYSLATKDPLIGSHMAVVKSGTPCISCHRDSKQATFAPIGAMVFTASKQFADKVAKSAEDDGGVLLTAPTIVTLDGQRAAINVSATGENKRVTSVSFEPHSTGKGSAEISVELTQSLDERVVSKQSGKTLWEPGRVIIVTDKDKRRLAIIEVSTTP